MDFEVMFCFMWWLHAIFFSYIAYDNFSPMSMELNLNMNIRIDWENLKIYEGVSKLLDVSKIIATQRNIYILFIFKLKPTLVIKNTKNSLKSFFTNSFNNSFVFSISSKQAGFSYSKIITKKK